MTLQLVLLGIYAILQLYFIIIIVSFILSWIPSSNDWKIGRLIYKMSNWYMDSFRGKLILGIFDMGSLVGYIVYQSILGLFLECIYML